MGRPTPDLAMFGRRIKSYAILVCGGAEGRGVAPCRRQPQVFARQDWCVAQQPTGAQRPLDPVTQGEPGFLTLAYTTPHGKILRAGPVGPVKSARFVPREFASATGGPHDIAAPARTSSASPDFCLLGLGGADRR